MLYRFELHNIQVAVVYLIIRKNPIHPTSISLKQRLVIHKVFLGGDKPKLNIFYIILKRLNQFRAYSIV